MIAERKAVDTLHGNEKTGTSAYFAIDLNDFTIGKYKFKLIAKDGFLSQVGESNSVDFDMSIMGDLDTRDLNNSRVLDVHTCEPPHLNWSTAMFRKRRTENGEQATEAGRDCLEVTAS